MKKAFIKYFSIAAILVGVACNESEDLVTDGAMIGGLVDATSRSLNYVVGNPDGPYTIEFFVHQGKESIESVKLYKSFITTVKYTLDEGEDTERDTTVTFTSNEVLDRTLEIDQAGNHFINTSYTFAELIADLEVAGPNSGPAPLPSTDGEYQIGDKWVFRVESVTGDDRTVEQSYTISVAVSTRYAGTYKPIAAEYNRYTGVWDSPADLSGWPPEVAIESVDATTYRVVDWLGPFDGNEWYFQINGDVITYPEKTPSGEDQTGNGLPFITCETNAADMPNDKSHCDDSNYVVNDDVGGKDQLVMTFGYMGANGPRIFYQVLEKIVD